MQKIIQSKWVFPLAFGVTLFALILSLIRPMASPQSIVVAFDTAGGTPVDIVTLPSDGKLATIPTSSKEGHSFEGWRKGQDTVTLQTVFTTNTTLRAQFEVLTFTISYETNGGADLADVVVDYGTTHRLPTPVKANSVFLGWHEDSALTTLVNEDIDIIRDWTFYAKWATLGVDLITVSLFSEELGLISTETVVPDSFVSLPIPTREGYTFRHWVNGSTQEISPNPVIVTTSTIFFAVWSSNAGLVTITFDTQGGTPVAPIQVPAGTAWSNPEAVPFLADGYQFLNWITDCRFDGFEVACVNLDSNFVVTDDLTALARYDYMIPFISMQFEAHIEDGRLIGYELTGISDFYSEDPISTLILPARFAGLPVVSIGDEAFAFIDYLDKVIIPENVRYIRSFAFGGSSIKEVFLPRTLEVIYDEAFADTAIEYVDVPVDGNLRAIYYGAFRSTALTSFAFPQSIEYIGSEAFTSTQLEAIQFSNPSQLKFIGSQAFAETMLTSVTLPEGLKHIRPMAFANIPTLTSLYLPASLIRLDVNAFASTGLTEVNFGQNSQLEIAGDYVFGIAESLIPLIANSLDEFIMVGPILVGYNGPLDDAADFVIPSSTRVISNSLNDYGPFNRGQLVLPSSLQMIGESAFSGSSFAGDLTLPDNIIVGPYAFFNVTIDGDVTLGAAKEFDQNSFNGLVANDVTLVPNARGLRQYNEFSNDVLRSNMFRNAQLDSLTIGEGYSYFPSNFTRSSSIPTMIFPASSSKFEFGSIGSMTLVDLTILGSDLLVEVNVETIPGEARSTPWYLAQGAYIILRNNLVIIDLGSLTAPYQIVVPDEARVLNRNAFNNLFVTYQSIDLNNIEYIAGNAAFSFNTDLKLNEALVLDNLRFFGTQFARNQTALFSNNTLSLTNYHFDLDLVSDYSSINFNTSFLRQISSFDNEGFRIAGNILLDYDPSLDLTPGDVTIPDNIDIIVSSAFNSVTFQGPLTLNEGLRYIDDYAFYNSQLVDNRVDFPSTLEFIGYDAFADVQLDHIVIPSSVREIESNAFNGTDFETFTFDDPSRSFIHQDVIGDVLDDNGNVKSAYRQFLQNGFVVLDGVLLAYTNHLRDAAIPEGVVNIAPSTFNQRRQTIKNITLPSTLKYISRRAFSGLRLLESIDFSHVTSLNFIGEYAFEYSSLSTLEIAAPVADLSMNALNNMPYLLTYSVNMVQPIPLRLDTSADLLD
jgi:hypothetical protein